jgi:glycerol kinase
MRHILAIDEGTTGVTCLMIGEDGRVAGRGYREIPQYFPQAGWVEHDALEILECVRRSRSASPISVRRW